MAKAINSDNMNDFEKTIREYLNQGRNKLSKELSGTREAIKLIAGEKTRDFIKSMDRGLSKEERAYMSDIIIESMCQSFCYGYGIGKMEGQTNKKVFL